MLNKLDDVFNTVVEFASYLFLTEHWHHIFQSNTITYFGRLQLQSLQ